MFAWLILISSAVFEAVWATALGRSEGFSRLWPTVIFVVACLISMGGLAVAMKSIPVGTAYAVWAGFGAVCTVSYSIATGQEAASVLKVLFLVLIISGIVGLKLVG
ncbi:DMT family transporter [Corynebacterium flavescens]